MRLSTSISPTRTGVLDPLAADVRPWRVAHQEATVLLQPLEDRYELFDLWVKTPEIVSRPAPQAQRLTQELLVWTGWSHRGLANVLEISHPTVSALEQGTSPARVGDLFDRLVEVHEVIRRVHLIADCDASRTSHLVSTPSESGTSAVNLLAQRRPAEAYLAALDAQRPRRVGPMMQSIWPARAGDATVDLAEDPV